MAIYDRERTEEELEELIRQLFDGTVQFDQIMQWARKQIAQAYTKGFGEAATMQTRIAESIRRA